MSEAKRATRVLEHTLLCQNEKCRERLGAMHMPCVGGRVTLICGKCKTISQFESGMRGVQAFWIPPPPTSPRS